MNINEKVLDFYLNENEQNMFKLSLLNLENKEIISDYTDIAYSFMAPILTKYVLWIDQVVTENALDGILFSARDGWLLKRMYDELVRRRGKGVESLYFYTSRKLAMISGMEGDRDFEFLASLPYTGEPEAVLRDMFHLSEAVIKKDVCGNGVEQYIKQYKEEIFAECKKQRANYQLYMKKIGLKQDKKYAFVDFVASGTVMNFLINEIFFDVIPVYACQYGSYAHDNVPEAKPMIKVKERGLQYNGSFFANNYTLFETVLTSCEPSVAAMNDQGEPEFATEIRDEEELRYVKEMQEAIFRYFTDYMELHNTQEYISYEAVDKLCSLMKSDSFRINCPYLSTLKIHQDLGFAEVKALKEEIKVSVVLTTHNRRYEVRRALEDVNNQTFRPYEIILVDDASTDGTKEYIDSFRFDNLKYIQLEQKQGPGIARNIGIKHANGNYIAFLDSDDQWKKEKLEKFVKAIQTVQDRNEEVDICFSSYRQHIELSTVLQPNMSLMTDPNNIQRNDLIMTKPIASSAAMYSKKILDKLGGFSEQYMTILDWELTVRYVKECHIRVYYIQEELTECWQMYDGLGEDKELMLAEKKKLLEEYEELFGGALLQEHKMIELELNNEIEAKNAEIASLNAKLDSSNNTIYRKSSFYNLLSKWMELELSGESLADKLILSGKRNIAIYGAGKHGELLYRDLLQNKKVKVCYFIDNKLAGQKHHGIKVYAPKDELPQVDAIIVTPYLELDSISSELNNPNRFDIISLYDMLQ